MLESQVKLTIASCAQFAQGTDVWSVWNASWHAAAPPHVLAHAPHRHAIKASACAFAWEPGQSATYRYSSLNQS